MSKSHSIESTKPCDTIVRQTADRIAAEILSQLGGTLQAMSEPEMRGYVRARAWPIVCDQLHQAQQSKTSGRTSGSRRDELAGHVLEQVVHVVTRACTSAPIISMPAPHIGRRAA